MPDAMKYSTTLGGGMKWGPSSNHPGLVIHSFGDTGTRTVANEVEPDTYRAMITRKDDDNNLIGEFFSNLGYPRSETNSFTLPWQRRQGSVFSFPSSEI